MGEKAHSCVSVLNTGSLPSILSSKKPYLILAATPRLTTVSLSLPPYRHVPPANASLTELLSSERRKNLRSELIRPIVQERQIITARPSLCCL